MKDLREQTAEEFLASLPKSLREGLDEYARETVRAAEEAARAEEPEYMAVVKFKGIYNEDLKAMMQKLVETSPEGSKLSIEMLDEAGKAKVDNLTGASDKWPLRAEVQSMLDKYADPHQIIIKGLDQDRSYLKNAPFGNLELTALELLASKDIPQNQVSGAISDSLSTGYSDVADLITKGLLEVHVNPNYCERIVQDSEQFADDEEFIEPWDLV